LVTRETGSVSIALWKSTYGNYPPTATGAMHIGATGPYISNNVKNETDNLSGWATVTGAYGEIMTISVTAVDAVKSATLALKYHQY